MNQTIKQPNPPTSVIDVLLQPLVSCFTNLVNSPDTIIPFKPASLTDKGRTEVIYKHKDEILSIIEEFSEVKDNRLKRRDTRLYKDHIGVYNSLYKKGEYKTDEGECLFEMALNIEHDNNKKQLASTASDVALPQSNDVSTVVAEMSEMERQRESFSTIIDDRLTAINDNVRGMKSIHGYRSDGKTVFASLIDYCEEALDYHCLGENPLFIRQLVKQFYMDIPYWRTRVDIRPTKPKRGVLTCE